MKTFHFICSVGFLIGSVIMFFNNDIILAMICGVSSVTQANAVDIIKLKEERK